MLLDSFLSRSHQHPGGQGQPMVVALETVVVDYLVRLVFGGPRSKERTAKRSIASSASRRVTLPGGVSSPPGHAGMRSLQFQW